MAGADSARVLCRAVINNQRRHEVLVQSEKDAAGNLVLNSIVAHVTGIVKS